MPDQPLWEVSLKLTLSAVMIVALNSLDVHSAFAQDSHPQGIKSVQNSHAQRPKNKIVALRDRPQDTQLRLAYRAVFGYRPARKELESRGFLTYRAGRVYWTNLGPILIAPAYHSDAWLTERGALGVFFLREIDGAFRLERAFYNSVQGSFMGNPPIWKLSAAFGGFPMIIATTRNTIGGIGCAKTSLYKLEYNVVSWLHTFNSEYDNSANEQDPSQIVRLIGNMKNIKRNGTFDVSYTGTKRFVHRYVPLFDGYDFAPSSSRELVPSCG